MKKILFFIAIVLAASGLAQQRNDAGVPYLGAITATDGNPWSANANAPKRDPQNGYAYYYRPAGTFYQAVCDVLSSDNYYVALTCTPMVIRPYSSVTYKAREANNYEWTYQQGGNWYTTNGNQELEVTYGCEIDTIPKLKIGPGNTYFTRNISDDNQLLRAEVRSIPNPVGFESQDNAGGSFYVSPKWWGLGDRDGGDTRIGNVYYNGTDAKYDEGMECCGGMEYSGRYFGKNTMGLDSATLWVEKPGQPYLLRNILLLFSNLNMTDSATFDVIIRKAIKDYATDYVTPSDILAKTSFSLDTNNVIMKPVSYYPILQDSVLWWHYYQLKTVVLTEPIVVDSEIMITLTGYNKENIKDFSLLTSLDNWDEGFGDHGYVYSQNQGKYLPVKKFLTPWNEYTDFYNGTMGGLIMDTICTAPSIFMDVKFPYTMLRDEDDTGVRQVGAAGGKVAVDLKSSDPGSEQQVTIESATPGSDDVSWLTVRFTDGETSELGEHSLTANLDVAPNTAGTPRSARVTITMPASPTVTLLVNQTDGIVGDVTGDGHVDIADVNAVINIMLGKADTTAVADVTGDGQVDIADVNAVINIMLGK